MTSAPVDSAVNPVLQPVQPGADLPHRKVLRSWLEPIVGRTYAWPIALLVFDLLLFTAAVAATVWFEPWWAKLIFGNVAGFVIGRLFIIGHDACHQSLTPNRTLNRWLGRVAFLPSLSTYSLWDIGHNVVHHGFTNLKGMDFVWVPISHAEYRALSPLKRLLYRAYRSGWAPGLYYMIEIWWNKMFFPNATHMPTRRAIFWKDSLLVTAFGAAWVGVLVWAALATGQAVWLTLLMGFAVPFFFWCSMIGFVVYVHHTHAKIAWYDDRTEWNRAHPFVTTTVHLTFRFHMGALLHHIMEHTAHHLDMSVPLYKLKEAQSRLEELLPGRIVVQPFSWAWYFRTARLSKLYDYQNRHWTDFTGQRTSEPVFAPVNAPRARKVAAMPTPQAA